MDTFMAHLIIFEFVSVGSLVANGRFVFLVGVCGVVVLHAFEQYEQSL